MKKIKFILVAITFSMLALTSCQDNGPVTPDQPDATASIALRTVLNKIKATNDPSGRYSSTERSTNDNDDGFCFDFVYPLQFEYNNGTLVSVDSFQGLIQVLMNETNELYIVGVVFPFDVVLLQDGTTVTINSEQDLVEVLENCDDFDVWDDEDVVVDCFEFVYPIDMIASDGTTVTVNSNDELVEFFETQDAMYEPNFVFPITVVNLDDEEIVIENIYDFFDLMDDCYAYDGNVDDCNCYDEYDPVCVYDMDSDMTIPFPNECFALCEGFTENDFVDCNFDDDCDISNLEVTVGDCNDDGTYSITINFEYDNPGNEYFDVYINDYGLFNYYALADLPITIEHFPTAGFGEDFLEISINDMPNCSEEIDWEVPECAIIPVDFMDYVGSCFDFEYPIEVSFQGMTYSVLSFTQLQQYFNPTSEGAEISFPVQIEISATGEIETIESMEELEDFIREHCL